jgi:hypothetical protein
VVAPARPSSAAPEPVDVLPSPAQLARWAAAGGFRRRSKAGLAAGRRLAPGGTPEQTGALQQLWTTTRQVYLPGDTRRLARLCGARPCSGRMSCALLLILLLVPLCSCSVRGAAAR